MIDGTSVTLVLKINSANDALAETDAENISETNARQITITVTDRHNDRYSATTTLPLDDLSLSPDLVSVPVLNPNELCAAVLQKLTLFYSKEMVSYKYMLVGLVW